MHDILKIAAEFQVEGTPERFEPYGSGHIHDTFLVHCAGQGPSPSASYILQKVNTHVFRNPDIIMKNIFTLDGHLKTQAGEPGGRQQSIIPEPVLTKNMKNSYRTPEGVQFRCFHFIPDTISYDRAEHPETAWEAARTFGKFTSRISSLDPGLIGITIPDFHNLDHRLSEMKEALGAASYGRKQKAKAALQAVKKRTHIADTFRKIQSLNLIPVRVCHMDTKINNVLLHRDTGEGVCVIDLDTLMPATILSDFGDMIRTFTNHADEDEADLAKVYCRLDIFRAMAEGFLGEAGPVLTDGEWAHLVFGGLLLTYMQSVRFLTDYLQGDIYYKTDHEEHNLIRTNNQLQLLISLENHENEMNQFINRLRHPGD